MLFLAGFAVGNAEAARRDYAGRTVAAIEFAPVDQPYPHSELISLLPVKAGSPLRLEDVRLSIERLYATGRYAEVEVDARFSGDQVVLRFHTEQNYFIGRVSVEGASDPPSGNVLANTAHLELGALFTEQKLGEATERLGAVLESNGFYNSRIRPEFERDPATQQVRIRFRIDTGERAKYTTPIITGEPERSPEQIIDTTHWRRIWGLGWRAVTETRTQSGLERIRNSYLKRDRLMSEVALTKMDYIPERNRVQPTLDVQAGPRIRIRTEGAGVSRGKLKQLVPVFEEQSVDRDLLLEGARNLAEYFEGQGYFHAKVDFLSMKTNGDGEEEIVYKIDRGDRHKVALLEIKGNRYFDTDTIRERMYVRAASFPQFRRGRYSENLIERDLDSIRDLYRSNGFRDMEVRSRVEHGYRGESTAMAVYVEIEEGPQWVVEDLDIQGASPEALAYLRSILQSQPGQPFSEVNVGIDRDNILDSYYDEGYPDATFQWSFSNGAPHAVKLKYVIQEGGRKFVRDVLIGGLSTTNPDLVRERVQLQPGDPLSRGAMLETQRRLYNLGIFAKVDTAMQNPNGVEDRKRILLQAEESARYTVTGGVGAEIAKIGGSSAVPEAPAGKTGFSPRIYFDVTRRNFLGEGHIVSFKSRLSTLQKRGVLSYQAPQFRGSPDISLTFSGTFDDSKNVNTFSSRRQEGAVQVGQTLSRASTMLYRFAYRKVSVRDLKINPLLFPQFAQSVRIGMLGASYVQDRRDDPTNATKGVYNTLDVGWAAQPLGSEASFLSVVGRNATYHPFGVGRRYVVARSMNFGWLQTLRETFDVPLPERFFAGGASSHRGFPFNQAGPRDAGTEGQPGTGFPLGGKAMFLNQTELRFPLLGENVGGVLFHDMGNVFEGLNKFSFRVQQKGLEDFNYMVHAVGFGVRYQTPIGPVRIDLAYAPNSPRFFGLKGTREELLENRGVPTMQRLSRIQFHFSIGQAF